jgi:hypothetical protein
MTPHLLPTLGTSLPAKPVAVVLSTQLLLTQKSSATLKFVKVDGLMESLKIRATLLTPVLLEIRGYRHGGLND